MWTLALLACSSPPADPLPAERAAYAALEPVRLAEAAELALGSGDLTTAAEAVVAGSRVDGARFAPMQTRLIEALTTAEPAAAAPAWAALYEGASTPQDRVRWRDAALDAAAKARLAPASREATARAVDGVTRGMALQAVSALREGYVDPLPDARLLGAAAHRLEALSGAPVEVPEGSFEAALDALWDDAVERGLPETIAVAELTDAAFSAADPWSMPVWPAEVAAWSQRHDGVQTGRIGVTLEDGPAGVVVTDLAEGGPAWTAGLHQGDVVRSIDGQAPADADAAGSALRGPDGVTVALRVERDGAERAFAVARGPIASRTVFGWQRTADGFDARVAPAVGFVRVASFRPHTDAELDAVMPAREGLTGLILDLRGNRGGDLDPAIRLVDRFVAEGALIGVSGRVIPEAMKDGVARATPGDPWEGLPLAVLVDGQTASSAEVVAGALQQLAGATVIGERTAGKGSSQILRTDPAWAHALQYTNLAWTLPDGRRLHRTDEATTWGVEPDVPVVLGATERFVVGVMQARREALVAHADGSPMRYAGPEADPGLPPLSADPAVHAAIAALGP